VVFLSYNLIAWNVMKKTYDFARYDFYVRQNFKLLYLQLKIQCLCSDNFYKKMNMIFYNSRYNAIAWKIYYLSRGSDIWYKLYLFMDKQIIISLHMMFLFWNIFWAICINVLRQFKIGRKWARHSKFQPQVLQIEINQKKLIVSDHFVFWTFCQKFCFEKILQDFFRTNFFTFRQDMATSSTFILFSNKISCKFSNLVEIVEKNAVEFFLFLLILLNKIPLQHLLIISRII
jgi:hypothetical protein